MNCLKQIFVSRPVSKEARTTTAARWAICLLVVTISFGLPNFARAQLCVEQVQRDFQVRYRLQMGTNGLNNTNFLMWPGCGDGTGATPQYPKDGYYGDLSKNLLLASNLVLDLVQKFYYSNIIYTNFVKETNGLAGLNGISNIVNYSSGDMVALYDTNSISTNNWMVELQSIAEQIAVLTNIQVHAKPIVASNYADTRITVCFVITNTDYCLTVQNCVTNHAAATPWGTSYFLDAANSCAVLSESDLSCAGAPVEQTNFSNPDGDAVAASYQRPTGHYLLVADDDGRLDNWDISGATPVWHDNLSLGDGSMPPALDYSISAGKWLGVFRDLSGEYAQNIVHLIGLEAVTSNLMDVTSAPLAPPSNADPPQSVVCDDGDGEGYILTGMNLYAYNTVTNILDASNNATAGCTITGPFVIPPEDGSTIVDVAVADASYFVTGEILTTDNGTFQVSSTSGSTDIYLLHLDDGNSDKSGETNDVSHQFTQMAYYSPDWGRPTIGYDQSTGKIYVTRVSGTGSVLLDVFQGVDLTHLKTVLVQSHSDVIDVNEFTSGCVFNPRTGLVYVLETETDGSVAYTITANVLTVNPSTWAVTRAVTWPTTAAFRIAYFSSANQLFISTLDYTTFDNLVHVVCCDGNTEVGTPLDTASDGYLAQPSYANINNYMYAPFPETTRVYGIPTNACQLPPTISRVFEYYQNTDPSAPSSVDYSAVAINTRGKISADLTPYPKGTNFVFLKLTRPPTTENWNSCSGAFGSISVTNTFGQDGPGSTSENAYGAWTNGALTMGADSTTTNYVDDSDIVPAAAGTCALGPDTLNGWVVADAVVIVAPDFTTTPDPDCCSSCKCIASADQSYLASVHYSVGLGQDNFGNSAGSLKIDADFPSLGLYSPTALRSLVGSNITVINDTNGTFRQVKTSQVLVDIVTNGQTNYSMSFYTTPNAGSTNSDGIYVPTGSPYTVITVENPDASLTVFNRLRTVNVTDGSTNITDFIYDPSTSQWALNTGGGLRQEARLSVWDPTGTIRTETHTISNIDNQLVYKEINTYVQYPWGQEMVTNIVDPDGAALTSSWMYYTNAATDGGNYRQLRQQIDANGHWITYQYDQYGRQTNRIEQFLNSALGTAASANRQTITYYSNGVPQITTIEKFLGSEIGRSYDVVDIGFDEHIQCQTVGASWDVTVATDDLVTITTQYTSGPFARQLQSLQNPDGTVQLYSYSTNSTQKTTVVLSGQPDPSNSTNILAGGTVTTTVTALGGQVLSSTSQYKVSGSPYITTSQDTYTYLDDQLRSYQVVHLDGTSNYAFYACCGLDSTIDADGVMTTYAHDGLKRQIASTRNGITVSNVLDALGNALVTIRNPGASQIVQHQAVYDLAGRLVQETNALGGVISYTNYFDGFGQLVKVTTNADLGTRIETYAQDGSLLSVSGTAARPLNYQYGLDGDGPYTATIKSDPIGGNTNEWSKVSSDMVGRSYKTTYPSATGNHAAVSYFNNVGQLVSQGDPDVITNLYTYNGLGQLDLTAIDINQNGSIDTSGPDRISESVADVVYDGSIGANVQRTRNYVYVDGSSTPLLVSMNETSTDGLRSWNTVYNNGNPVTSQSITVYSTGGYRYQTNIAPDNSYTVSTYLNGQLVSVVQKDSGNNQIGGTTYGYDAFGRQNTSQDARNGTTTYYFNNADQINRVLTPSPDGVLSGQATAAFFDNMGRTTGSVLPDNTATTNLYYVTGDLMLTYGSRTYPVGYTYDAQGRMKTMTNWSSFAALTGARVTTWNYNPYSGLLSGKTYDNGSTAGPSYSFTPAGRLYTRTWARPITTTYTYNAAGDLATVIYSDGLTPGLTNGYDRRGRQTIITNGATVCNLTYNDANEVLSESYTGGPLDTVSVTNGYDGLLRRANCVTRVGSTAVTSTTYNYDAASRLNIVSDGTNSATYFYLANSPLVNGISFAHSSTTTMSRTNKYDYLNRLTSISSANASSVVLDSHSYAYNNANQRTAMTNADNTQWKYAYDSLGQVTSGSNYWGDGSLIAGRQYNYSFDDIGNRTSANFGGDTNGSNLRSASYTPNNLNQYSSRTVPGYLEVEGSATNTATVTVNGQSTYRKTNYYWAELTVPNVSSAVLQEVTNMAVLSPGPNGTITGSTFVAQTPENFTYDLDGNLTSDGRWTNTWDAENRLINMTSLSNGPSGSLMKLDFAYDYRGRRIQKLVSTLIGLSYAPQSTNRFAYDGWNLQATLNPALSTTALFMWGTDLSGSGQGSGGAGGLLKVSCYGTNCFATFDGNGNLCALASAANGSLLAQYEYGPFGELIRADNALAFINPFRFSTKYQDDETALLYFGYRYYAQSTGAWTGKDPIDENGGLNLYSIAGENPVGTIDILGLSPFAPPLQFGFSVPLGYPISQPAPDLSTKAINYVAKSFINGVPSVGRFPSGLNLPGLGTARIAYPLPQPINNIIDTSIFSANGRMGPFSWFVKHLDAFNQSPNSDAKDGSYRLYTSVTILVSCCKDKPQIMLITDKDGGHELGPLFGTINMTSDVKELTPTSAAVHWRGWGRPNALLEPGMQLVGGRSSVNIWHDVTVVTSCKNGVVQFQSPQVAYSAFPSFRLWKNGELITDAPQGSFTDLWNPDNTDLNFVAP